MDFAVNQRLRDYLQFKKISFDNFRKAANVGRIQQVSGWMTLRESVPAKVLIESVRIYEDLNPRWLLFGEGVMMKGIDVKEDSYSHQIKNSEGEVEIYKDYVATLKKVINNLETTVETQRQSFELLKESHKN